MACIEARGLRKAFGSTIALDGIDLRVEEGRVLGLIGPNGAGKTTALNTILGLTLYQGELRVLGRDPWTERDRLIRSVQDAGIEPNRNVYAELGGTWWFLMRNPTQAAHVLGKLLRY